jgi:hypothetical protein
MKEKVNGMRRVVGDNRPVRKSVALRSGATEIKRLAIEFANEEIHVIAIRAGDLNGLANLPKRCELLKQAHAISQSGEIPTSLRAHRTTLRLRMRRTNVSKTGQQEKRHARIK